MANAHTLTVESKGSFLHCVVRGENGRETVLAYFREIREACRTRDCYRVLVEERLDGPRLPPAELLQLMAEVATSAGATFEALAYVDINAHSDIIARLAGQVVQPGAAVGVFGTVADAERWMRAKEQGSPPTP
jgi:hypothetical protein